MQYGKGGDEVIVGGWPVTPWTLNQERTPHGMQWVLSVEAPGQWRQDGIWVTVAQAQAIVGGADPLAVLASSRGLAVRVLTWQELLKR